MGLMTYNSESVKQRVLVSFEGRFNFYIIVSKARSSLNTLVCWVIIENQSNREPVGLFLWSFLLLQVSFQIDHGFESAQLLEHVGLMTYDCKSIQDGNEAQDAISVYICRSPQKSPRNLGSFAERDLQLRTFDPSSPPCRSCFDVSFNGLVNSSLRMYIALFRCLF